MGLDKLLPLGIFAFLHLIMDVLGLRATLLRVTIGIFGEQTTALALLSHLPVGPHTHQQPNSSCTAHVRDCGSFHTHHMACWLSS